MFHSFLYIFIYIYIYIYILKKEWNVLRSFAKERNVLAFFYVLCKRILRSLCSFTFFSKERNVLLGLLSHQKLEKRTERSLKEQKRMEHSEGKRMQCPTLLTGKDHCVILFTNIGVEDWKSTGGKKII